MRGSDTDCSDCACARASRAGFSFALSCAARLVVNAAYEIIEAAAQITGRAFQARFFCPLIFHPNATTLRRP
jgi:hypothetical protein